MTLLVKVKPGSKQDELFKKGNNYDLSVKARAVGGEANKAAIRYLSKLFRVSKRDILLIRGKTSQLKVFEINGLTKEELESVLESVPGDRNDR